jgi:DNA-binding NarL/FixJ family response regulator
MINHMLEIHELTFREIHIIRFIQEGYSSKEIAAQLAISEKTIKRHRQNISKKAGTNGKMDFRKFIMNFPTIYGVKSTINC